MERNANCTSIICANKNGIPALTGSATLVAACFDLRFERQCSASAGSLLSMICYAKQIKPNSGFVG